MAPPISVIKIVKYCGVGGGGGHWGAKILPKIKAPLLSVNKIIKYSGQIYNAYKQGRESRGGGMEGCIPPIAPLKKNISNVYFIPRLSPPPPMF